LASGIDRVEAVAEGVIPDAIRRELKVAQQQAMMNGGRPKLRGLQVDCQGRGSYRFVVTSPDAVFLLDRSQSSYTIKVQLKNEALWRKREGGVNTLLRRAKETIQQLGVVLKGPWLLTRIDYCVDLACGMNFYPDQNSILKACNAIIDTHGTHANRPETVSIGRLPRTRILIYRKDIEIRKHRKEWFRTVWSGYRGAVLRVEVQLGKDALKNWGAQDLDRWRTCSPDILRDALKRTRYVDRSHTRIRNDQTASWWKLVQDAVGTTIGALKGQILTGDRRKRAEDFEKQAYGLIRSITVLLRISPNEYLDTFSKNALKAITTDPNYQKKRRDLEDKYALMK